MTTINPQTKKGKMTNNCLKKGHNGPVVKRAPHRLAQLAHCATNA
jgi:hypothetical protein